MEIAIVEIDVAVVAESRRASTLIGARVANDEGEHTGTIDDLMLVGDRVQYAVLSVGGFLGLGAHLVAVPFGSLRIDDGHVVLPGATRDALKRLPKFEYR